MHELQFQKKKENSMKKNKKTLIAAIVFVLVIIVLGGVYYFTKPKTTEGQKDVTLVVVNKAGEETTYKVNTDAEYLIEVMEDAKEQGLTYDGEDGDYGMMINTVNGEEAVFANDGAYWGFSVNGNYCEYGVSEQPVADGDEFEIKYTIDE